MKIHLNFKLTKYLLAMTVLLASCASAPLPNEWSYAANLSTGRSEVHAAKLGGTIYIAGGIGKFRILKTCEALIVADGIWKQCPDLPVPLHHIAMASNDRQVFAAGGYVSLGFKHLSLPKLLSLSPDATSWEPVVDLPNPIGEHVLVWADNHLFLIGGTKPGGDTGDVWRLNKKQSEWTKMASMPTPRNSMAAAVVNDEIWVLGGRSDALGTKISRVEIYSPANDKWRVGPDLPVGRGGLSAAYLRGKIHVFGGETFNPLKMLDRHDVLDIATNKWTMAEPSPKPRHGTAAITSGDKIFLLGGGARPGLHTIYSASSVVQVWRK